MRFPFWHITPRLDLVRIAALLSQQDRGASVSAAWNELLPRLCEVILPEGGSVSGVWLADYQGSSPILALWLTSNHPRGPDGPLGVLKEWSGSSLKTGHLTFENRSQLQELIGFSAESPTSWGAPPEYKQIVIPLTAGRAGSDEIDLIGVITIADSSSRIRKLFDSKGMYLDLVAIGSLVGTWMRFNRRARAIDAIDSFQARIKGLFDPESVLKAAALVLSEKASAQIGCAIYTHADKGRFARLASTFEEEDSDARRFAAIAFESIEPTILGFHNGQIQGNEPTVDGPALRLVDLPAPEYSSFGEHNQVRRVALGSGPISLMMLRVDCRDIAGDNSYPLLTIVLLTRAEPSFIGGVFSRTNLEILRRIGIYLRDVMPPLLLRKQMAKVNTALLEHNSSREARVTDEALDADRSFFANLINSSIHVVTNCYVVEPASDGARVIFDPHGLVANPPRWIESAMSSDIKSPTRLMDDDGYAFGVQVPLNKGPKVIIVCRICVPRLAEHHTVLLDRIVTEFQLAFLRFLDPEEWTLQLAEIRHNLRNSINSVIHSSTAVFERFEAVRRLEPSIIHERLINQARFRRDIDRLRLSSQELHTLFENARVLLRDLTRDKLQVSEVSIPELIRSHLSLFTQELKRRNLEATFKSEWSDQFGFIQADRALLSLVLFNLIDNAVKYSYRNKAITLRLWAEGPFWRLSIANTGPYIEPARRELIFEPYRRLTPLKGQQVMPGTGLGLPAIRTISELHSNSEVRPSSLPPVLVESAVLERNATGEETVALTRFTITWPRKLGR